MVKGALIFLLALSVSTPSNAGNNEWIPAGTPTPPGLSVSKVEFGYETAAGWQGHYVQALAGDGRWYTYYFSQPYCSESGGTFVTSILLAAKATGSKVRFYVTIDGSNPIFRAIKIE